MAAYKIKESALYPKSEGLGKQNHTWISPAEMINYINKTWSLNVDINTLIIVPVEKEE